MKALTIRQPWAWAVKDAYGWWWSPYGGRRKKQIATKRERRWLKRQLKKETEE